MRQALLVLAVLAIGGDALAQSGSPLGEDSRGRQMIELLKRMAFIAGNRDGGDEDGGS